VKFDRNVGNASGIGRGLFHVLCCLHGDIDSIRENIMQPVSMSRFQPRNSVLPQRVTLVSSHNYENTGRPTDLNFVKVTNLMHKFFIRLILHSSTCFEQYYAHPQEVKLYVYSLWYRHSL
jgi:hypothetical protein